MDVIMIVIAMTLGAVFGLVIGYKMNSKYFDELYYIFDEDKKNRSQSWKKKEDHLLRELARRDVKIAELERDKINETSPAVVITSINKADESWIYEDYQEIDFKGDF